LSKGDYLSKANSFNVRERANRQTRARAARARRARDAWRKFTEIYGIPRASAARVMHLFPVTKYTVDLVVTYDFYFEAHEA
jgi:hypothetical protein